MHMGSIGAHLVSAPLAWDENIFTGTATGRGITFVGEAELSALLLHPLRHAHHLPQHALRVGAAPHPGLQQASHHCCCVLRKQDNCSGCIQSRLLPCIHPSLHCTEGDEAAGGHMLSMCCVPLATFTGRVIRIQQRINHQAGLTPASAQQAAGRGGSPSGQLPACAGAAASSLRCYPGPHTQSQSAACPPATWVDL